MDRFKKFVDSNKWKSSTSARYKDAPHQYVLRFELKDSKEFDWAVEYIKENGRQERFWRAVFTYLYLGDYKYWAMRAKKGGEIEIINRAKV